MLVCEDTVYFGICDSIVVIPNNKGFKLQKNFLLRNNIFYQNKPHKKEQIEARMKRYYYLWDKAVSYSTKDTTTKKQDYSIVSAELYFKQFEGKTIRSISFSNVDMFDGEIQDTTQKATNTISKYLNKTHVTTREHTVRNHLRFDEGEKISAHVLSENERLIRQLSYIEEVQIMIKEDNHLSDSVDILIITKDCFPYGINISIDDYNAYSITPYMNNFLGLGDHLEVGLYYDGYSESPWGHNFKYKADNIFGSFIDMQAYRSHYSDKNNYGILIERPFKTTDMKIGGALSYKNLHENRSYDDVLQDTTLTSEFIENQYDGWLGRTFIPKNNALPNLSIAGRMYMNTYSKRPEIRKDYNLNFHDWTGILGSIMLQKVTFFQTHKLSGFGVTEDVPVGYEIKVTTGHSWNEYFDRPYIGFNFRTQIVRPQAGLLSLNVAYGGFYNTNKIEDSYSNIGINYCSPLKTVGNMEMRHFIYTSCQLLINEHYYSPFDFSDKNMGTIQSGIEANSTFAVQYKPTIHLPFSLIGFKFSLSPFTTVGIASEDEFFKNNNNIYTYHGITFHSKNESLIFSTLGIDIRYYPIYEGDKNTVIFSIYLKNNKPFNNLLSPKPILNKK